MGRFLDLLPERLRDQLLHEVAEHALATLFLHHLHHLLPNLADLSRTSVASLLDLLLAPLCESDAEHPEDVSISRLHLAMRLDERMPLAYELHLLVTRKVHAVEIRQAVAALHLLNLQLDFAVGLVIVIVQI